MYKIECYIPKTHIEVVKEAIFKAGAGQLGEYQSCAWQVMGHGQFEPQKGSDPFIGSHGKLETVEEFKIEVICLPENLEEVMIALKAAHPYETPAYFVTNGLDV